MKLATLPRAIGLAALIAAAPALAQAPAPAAKPAAPAAAPAATPAEPTAAQLALGRDIVIASGMSRSFDVAVPQFLDQIATRLTQTRPDLIKDLNVVLEQIKPEFDKRTSTVVDQAARSYAQRFSEDEMKQIVGFFKSPAGAKYLETQPLVFNDVFVALQAWQKQLSTDMMARVREEMKKKGHDI